MDVSLPEPAGAATCDVCDPILISLRFILSIVLVLISGC